MLTTLSHTKFTHLDFYPQIVTQNEKNSSKKKNILMPNHVSVVTKLVDLNIMFLAYIYICDQA